MTENDKILINAYLDGETSDNDTKYVEALLESNNNANEYANKIKSANNEISLFYKKDHDEISKNISSFIEKELLEQKSNHVDINFFNRFTSSLSGISITTNYALTAILFFAVGLSFNQIPQFNNQMGFTDSIVKLNILKTRSSNNSSDLQIKTLLERMIKEKKRNGELIFDNEISYLQISKKTLSNNNYESFEGNLVTNKINKNFLFCISPASTSLLYSDL